MAKTFITVMETRRKELGMTQMDLAYKSKTGFAEISRCENGWAKPYPATAKRLAEVLGIPADTLTKEAEYI